MFYIERFFNESKKNILPSTQGGCVVNKIALFHVLKSLDQYASFGHPHKYKALVMHVLVCFRTI